MKRLMRGKSGNSNNIARDAVHGSSVLPFVTQRHDLKSLEATLQVAIRRAALRVYVLQVSSIYLNLSAGCENLLEREAWGSIPRQV